MLQARVQDNDKFRDEARTAIADIKKAKEQSDRAGSFARRLASNTDEDIEAVISGATEAIEEFKADYEAAEALVT